MSEVIKYHPENIKPSEFMRSPTEPFRPWFEVLSLQLEDLINEYGLSITGNPQTQLRIGTELEVVLFSGKFNPQIHREDKKEHNPNYANINLWNVAYLNKKIVQPIEYGGLGEILSKDEPIEIGRIATELRTNPTDAEGYFDQVQRIQEWLRDRSEYTDIKPALFSQHIHLSLAGDDTSDVFSDSWVRRTVGKSYADIYHRMLPVVCLPEEVDNERYFSSGYKNKYDTPRRIETRHNSTEYAFDPYLNLAVQLLGLYRGIIYSQVSNGTMSNDDYMAIDSDYPLYESESDYPAIRFKKGISYQSLVDRLTCDKVLLEYFPKKLLECIQDIVIDYGKVSSGQMTAEELRNIAREKALALDSDMFIANAG